jgi:hypothetical protein
LTIAVFSVERTEESTCNDWESVNATNWTI